MVARLPELTRNSILIPSTLINDFEGVETVVTNADGSSGRSSSYRTSTNRITCMMNFAWLYFLCEVSAAFFCPRKVVARACTQAGMRAAAILRALPMVGPFARETILV